MTKTASELADDAMEHAYRARPELRPTTHKAATMSTQKKYEHLTPLERHRLAQDNEREFRALKRDHATRLSELDAQRKSCTTLAEHNKVMASIRELLHIPKSPRGQGPSAA